ncbi:BCCT family transporter [Pseudomonas indica]|uniref:BCCT family transporter n=1 Tax=Pseudomonas indica TaxID=137658 RepID=UPI001C3EACE9|nr:BCCT family transporter [Pseudomonas indica]
MSVQSMQALGSRSFKTVNPPVFFGSLLVVTLFVVATLTNLHASEAAFAAIKKGITHNFGWFFILSVQAFLLFSLYLALSRFAHIRLGGSQARPDYGFAAWFAMLFSAGMGIGLVFWSVAEPVYHFASPPRIEGHSIEAAKRAMELSFLHWGLHAWGVYALVGLTLAYFSYNRGLPLTIRSAFQPLLGDRIQGPLGHLIDIVAVVATLFGVATSLGLGVSQVAAGLGGLLGFVPDTAAHLWLVAGITALATLSVALGLDKGIKWLSQINLWAALGLLLFVIALGPTLFILSGVVQNTGDYLQNLLSLGSWTETYRPDSTWQSDWTVFYWAWWISWSPFVGLFIARISRGRTVREFVLGVLLVPTLLTFLWITAFGGAALYEELFGAGGIEAAVQADVSMAFFALLAHYPLSSISSVLAMPLVVVFFVTSADSGALVIDTITAGGRLDSPVGQRVFWSSCAGGVAAVLLLGGGLSALQTAAISTGLPFAAILWLMLFSLNKALREDLPLPSAPLAGGSSKSA